MRDPPGFVAFSVSGPRPRRQGEEIRAALDKCCDHSNELRATHHDNWGCTKRRRRAMRKLSICAAVISVGFAVGCESSGKRPDAAEGAVDVTERVARRPTATSPTASPARGAPLFDNLGNYHHAITTR